MGKRKVADRFPDKQPNSRGSRYRVWQASQIQLFQAILQGMAEGVIVMTPDYRITFANSAAENLVFIDQTDPPSLMINSLFCDEQDCPCGLKLLLEAESEPINSKLVRLRQRGNSFISAEISISSLKMDGETVRIIVTLRDVSLELAQKKKLEVQALTDRLTGCFNRWWFEEEYLLSLEAAQATPGWLGIIFIDLDNFKKFNDESFLWGDRLIKAAADIIRSVLRPRDKLVRLGGDEFLLLYSDISPQGILDIAERIQTALKSRDLRMPRNPDMKFLLTASIGASVLHGTDARIIDLLDLAEEAKRTAKRLGKDRIVFLPEENASVTVIH
ncbi:MAG: diguanylate cyclase [Patescibacteria group bacterium]|nr:diguanylate cyclase [Patescibacteria group bacterium]